MAETAKSRPNTVSLQAMNEEEGASQLAKSIEPYIRFAMADMAGPGARQQALNELCALPLEKRYLWRIVSALKWAFVDLDDLSVVADKATLSPDDFQKVVELLKFRPWQFCVFLSALFGPEKMEKVMTGAIAEAKKVTISTIQT